MVILFLFYQIRIVIFVKMRGSVGQAFALNVMPVCAGHIFTSHGECYIIRTSVICFYVEICNSYEHFGLLTSIFCFDILSQ